MMTTRSQPGTSTDPAADQQVERALTGMTCASCANRIERKLNKLDGVTATVNYTTEKAKVTYADSVSTDDLVAAVEAAGYPALLPKPPTSESSTREDEVEHDPVRTLRQRLVISALLSAPVIAMAMVPALQFDNW